MFHSQNLAFLFSKYVSEYDLFLFPTWSLFVEFFTSFVCFALCLKRWLPLGHSLREERARLLPADTGSGELLSFAGTSTFQSI